MVGPPPRTDESLNSLDRKIVAALQLRPRATWSTVADALGAPERSVARRGSELLTTGAVRVVGVSGANSTVLAWATTVVNTTRGVLSALCQRRDCTFAYALTGAWPVLAELRVDHADLAGIALDELPTIPGIRGLRLDRVSHVYRSVREWSPDILAPDERRSLVGGNGRLTAPADYPDPDVSAQDRLLLRMLAEDGRTTTAELAARSRLSENTVRRRLQWLENNHYSRLRVVVDPALLGFPVEAIVRITAAPHASHELLERLLGYSQIRYLVALGSDHDIVAHFACPDLRSLHDILSAATWLTSTTHLEVSHLLSADKRSGYTMGKRGEGRSLY